MMMMMTGDVDDGGTGSVCSRAHLALARQQRVDVLVLLQLLVPLLAVLQHAAHVVARQQRAAQRVADPLGGLAGLQGSRHGVRDAVAISSSLGAGWRCCCVSSGAITSCHSACIRG